MTVIARPTDPTHHLPGAEFTSLATPSSGSQDISIWEVRLTQESQAAVHSLTHSEVFVVLEGSARATVGSVTEELTAGDSLVVPPNTDFSLAVAGADEFRAICCMPAAGKARMGEGEPFTPPWAQ